MVAIRLTLITLIFILWGIAGCKPGSVEVVSEADEKQYQLAKDYQSQGRTEDALRAFKRVIEARRNAPESHLEAGYIYLNAMGDPIKAIYHFEQYLELKPDSPQATRVRKLIETAEKKFAQQLPAQPYEGELDRLEMMELVNSLKQENNRLKRELVATQQRLQDLENRSGNVTTGTATQQQRTYNQNRSATISPDPASVPRAYTVQSGDSLSSISRKMYGTPSRWIDIYQANRDRLASENALRVGQELRIP
jgi:nucleoid-associated protein YgaU